MKTTTGSADTTTGVLRAIFWLREMGRPILADKMERELLYADTLAQQAVTQSTQTTRLATAAQNQATASQQAANAAKTGGNAATASLRPWIKITNVELMPSDDKSVAKTLMFHWPKRRD